MRCKCGYNSFDHNLVCPKCHRDLTATRRLLNLDLPAPGAVNFFQLAGQRMAAPLPFLAAGSEDLQPQADDAEPPPAAETLSTQPWPDPPAYGEISPDSPPRVFDVPAEEPMIEIEVADDFEIDQGPARPDFAPAAPLPAHQAAMNQIKSALTETGDLNPETYVLDGGRGRDAEPPAAAPGEGQGDDLAHLVRDVNLDELDGDL